MDDCSSTAIAYTQRGAVISMVLSTIIRMVRTTCHLHSAIPGIIHTRHPHKEKNIGREYDGEDFHLTAKIDKSHETSTN